MKDSLCRKCKLADSFIPCVTDISNQEGLMKNFDIKLTNGVTEQRNSQCDKNYISPDSLCDWYIKQEGLKALNRSHE